MGDQSIGFEAIFPVTEIAEENGLLLLILALGGLSRKHEPLRFQDYFQRSGRKQSPFRFMTPRGPEGVSIIFIAERKLLDAG